MARSRSGKQPGLCVPSFPIIEVTTQSEADKAESLMEIFTGGNKLKPKEVGAAYVA